MPDLTFEGSSSCSWLGSGQLGSITRRQRCTDLMRATKANRSQPEVGLVHLDDELAQG
jgi:hypothetical protein